MTVIASLSPTQPNNRGRVDKEDFESSLKKGQALLSYFVCACLFVKNRRTQTLKQRPCLSFCHSCAQCNLNDSEVAVTATPYKGKNSAYWKGHWCFFLYSNSLALSFITWQHKLIIWTCFVTWCVDNKLNMNNNNVKTCWYPSIAHLMEQIHLHFITYMNPQRL